MEETLKIASRDLKQEIQIIDQWLAKILDFLPHLMIGLVILMVFILLSRLAHRFGVYLSHQLNYTNPTGVRILEIFLRYGIILFGVFLSFEIMGIGTALTKLMGGLGVMGIIAGVALQGLASSTFSGFLVKFDKSFKIGDFVRIQGITGKVEKIGLVTTVIKAIDGTKVFIPNQLIFTQTFVNVTDSGVRRVIVPIGVSYGDDLETVRKITIDEVKKMPFVDTSAGSIDVDFIDIGPSTYDFEVRFWVKEEVEHREARSRTIVHLKARYDKEGVDLAYPTQTLDLSENVINLLRKN